MNEKDVAVRIYGLFGEGRPDFAKKVPIKTLNACNGFFQKENIVGIPEKELKKSIDILRDRNRDPVNYSVECRELNRGIDEHFGDNIQLITAVCIHDETSFLGLRLTDDTTIDGYVPGTITYPQGHCTWNKSFQDMAMPHSQRWTYLSLIAKAKDDAFREIQEELFIEDDYYRAEFMMSLHHRLFYHPTSARPYPIYVNKSGTTRRHLCILFDVDMSNTIFSTMKEYIDSNEPQKHSVAIMTFDDLLKLERVDMICPWVAASFSKIPFFHSSFLKGHLRVMPS